MKLTNNDTREPFVPLAGVEYRGHSRLPDESPFAEMQLNNAIANRIAKICIECELEDSDPTRFDGNYCHGCADYMETTIR